MLSINDDLYFPKRSNSSMTMLNEVFVLKIILKIIKHYQYTYKKNNETQSIYLLKIIMKHNQYTYK